MTDERMVEDDVRSVMSFAPCNPGRYHVVVSSGLVNYWLCSVCGLQVQWPVEGRVVEHKQPGDSILDRWTKR